MTYDWRQIFFKLVFISDGKKTFWNVEEKDFDDTLTVGKFVDVQQVGTTAGNCFLFDFKV
jgi:hypothetical protein